MRTINLHPQSVPGRYWVDCDNCCAHGICADFAPDNFRDSEEGPSCYFVFKQPETEREERQCHEALANCPVDAIHDSGARASV